ncbi:MAG: hypothetical protein DRN06_02125 [Thermoprotei archaeon]|nr:MAG: hypothetical protein DRN06_02125 [Thermoprotei archaeon]
MIEVFLETFNALLALLMAAFMVYMVKLFKGSMFESDWRLFVAALILLAISQQPFIVHLTGLSLARDFSMTFSLLFMTYAMYRIKKRWLEVTPQGMEPSS